MKHLTVYWLDFLRMGGAASYYRLYKLKMLKSDVYLQTWYEICLTTNI
jgi:hypothetical protein